MTALRRDASAPGSDPPGSVARSLASAPLASSGWVCRSWSRRAILVLAVYTQITLTFEGRLWTLPARVYSARLHLVTGQSGRRRRARRPTRSLRLCARGYAPVATRPVPEARHRAWTCSCAGSRGRRRARRRTARRASAFDGDSIASIRDERGRPRRVGRSRAGAAVARFRPSAGRADDRPARRGAEDPRQRRARRRGRAFLSARGHRPARRRCGRRSPT